MPPRRPTHILLWVRAFLPLSVRPDVTRRLGFQELFDPPHDLLGRVLLQEMTRVVGLAADRMREALLPPAVDPRREHGVLHAPGEEHRGACERGEPVLDALH